MYSNKSLSEAIRERLFSAEGNNEDSMQLTAAAKRYQPQDKNPYSPAVAKSSRRTSTQPKILLGSSHPSFMTPASAA